MDDDKVTNEEMRRLLRLAESDGWEAAFYEYSKARVASGSTVPEDPRILDWRYLLPLSGSMCALVLGCGWGTIPMGLSRTCRTVYAVDSSWEKVAFLNARRRQQGIPNLCPVYASGDLDLPFPGGYFDFVSVGRFQLTVTPPAGVRDVLQRMYDLLKDGGILQVSLGNRLAFQHLFRREKNAASLPLHTLFGYRRILQAEGYSEIQFYAPLPHDAGIPLFYVPIDDTQAFSFFLRNLFPLFEMVSPEVKQAYALPYLVAKIGVRLALLLRLTRLAKFFVPGFCIIARKQRMEQT